MLLFLCLKYLRQLGVNVRGTAEVIAREDIRNEEMYGQDVKDDGRDAFERILRIDAESLVCDGGMPLLNRR